MSKDIRAILWDNDGVLVDTEHLYYRATRRVLAGAGVELDRETFVELLLRQSRGAWHLAAERGASPADVERMRDERNALYARLLHKEATAIDGAKEALAGLHGRFTMGIVTSSRKDHLQIIHRETGMLQYVDFVIASGDYTHAKPHPEPYLLAVERTGLAAEQCVVVEDSERGLAAATGAGLRCLVVPHGLTADGDFGDATCVLDSVTQVPAAIEAMQRDET